MSADGERFDGFTTTAEERWLTGSGPEPVRAGAGLPARAPVMIPRGAAGSWPVDDVRTVRVWVDEQGTLRVRDRDGSTRELAPARAVTGVWWVAGAAPEALGLPPSTADQLLSVSRGRGAKVAGSAGGWLVLTGISEPVLALRLAEWLPRGGSPDDADAVRSAGAEAIAQALGVSLEAVADGAEAARVVGQVPVEARLALDPPVDRSKAMRFLLPPVLLLAAYWVLLATIPTAVATALAGGLLVLSAVAADLPPWRARVRRVRDLPGGARSWWASGSRVGAGIALVPGVLGEEVVLADGRGWEAWFPAPSAGGAASLVLATDAAGAPWAALVYDAAQRLLELVPADDWAPFHDLDAGASAMGLRASTAVRDHPELVSGAAAARAARSPIDSAAGLGATQLTGILTALFALTALVDLLLADAVVLLGVGAGLLVSRLLLRRRTIL